MAPGVGLNLQYTEKRPLVDTKPVCPDGHTPRLNRVKVGLFYLAGRNCTDWKAKDGACDACLKGGGGPFAITRECSMETGSTCVKNVEVASVDCVKYCSSGKFFRSRASLQHLFSSFV